jgi:hypothetical protein
VWVNGRGPVHFRDLTPKDFYFIQVLRNTEVSDKDLAFAILSRLLLEEESLDSLSIFETQKTFEWALDNLLTEKIMPVENWLETAFHLCKQRWDESIEWMETLPVPKILLMIDIVNRHAKDQEAAMKKASRK